VRVRRGARRTADPKDQGESTHSDWVAAMSSGDSPARSGRGPCRSKCARPLRTRKSCGGQSLECRFSASYSGTAIASVMAVMRAALRQARILAGVTAAVGMILTAPAMAASCGTEELMPCCKEETGLRTAGCCGLRACSIDKPAAQRTPDLVPVAHGAVTFCTPLRLTERRPRATAAMITIAPPVPRPVLRI
jgi:hypothetical protein